MLGILQFIDAKTEDEVNAGIDSLKTALNIDPNNISAMTHIAETSISFNKIDEAKEYINKAITADPLNWRSYLVRAKIEKYNEALSDIELAKKYSFNLSPEPYISEGNIYYALGELEKGRNSFENALKIYSFGIEGHLGVAKYFMLKKDFLHAVLIYNDIVNSFPQSPEALFYAAQCYEDLNKTDKAFELYSGSINKWAKVMQKAAPGDVFLSAGALAVKTKNIELTFAFLLQYLQYYFSSKESVFVHKTLASLILENNYSAAVAKGHLLCAYALNNKDEHIIKQLQKLQNILMTQDDIKIMLKAGYPAAVAAEIISITPLDFTISTKEELQKYAEELPEVVIKGILISNELYKSQK
jgi:tetratricopeptide (TPR) repeat protein